MTRTQYLSCTYGHICSGCNFLHLSNEEIFQLRREKIIELGIVNSDASSTIEFQWIDAGKLRDRLEFTLETDSNGTKRLGLYSKVPSSREREIIDLAGCPQLTPDLEAWLQDFRKDLPPLKKRAGIRLRVSPGNVRGLWIDAANEDIRDLLDEGHWLARQLNNAVIIEAGQKRKRVAFNVPKDIAHSNETGSRVRQVMLTDPTLEPWFETSTSPKIEIFGSVGTFTQPGFRAGQRLVETVTEHLTQVATPNTHQITEFGCGSGTLTLALVTKGFSIQAYEFDGLAIEALEKSFLLTGLPRERLQIFRGDFIQSPKAFTKVETSYSQSLKTVFLVDPPRAGLGVFLDRILEKESTDRTSKPKWIYVSCYPESFAADLQKLKNHGYQLKRLTVVEQFPYTSHFELVATIENCRD